jgi:hypothetical protein
MRMVLEGDSTPVRLDFRCSRGVARARRWADDLVAGRVRSVGELARREGIDGAHTANRSSLAVERATPGARYPKAHASLRRLGAKFSGRERATASNFAIRGYVRLGAGIL